MSDLAEIGALHQIHSESECLCVTGPPPEDLFEVTDPDVVEQILNPGEFFEVDVDQLLAELEVMRVRALEQ